MKLTTFLLSALAASSALATCPDYTTYSQVGSGILYPFSNLYAATSRITINRPFGSALHETRPGMSHFQ